MVRKWYEKCYRLGHDLEDASVSEVVEDLDLTSIPARGRSPKYPWDDWFDSNTHRLVRGEDYDAESPKAFRSTVYSAAKRKGLTVVTRIIKGDLYVQALPPSENGQKESERAEEDQGAAR